MDSILQDLRYVAPRLARSRGSERVAAYSYSVRILIAHGDPLRLTGTAVAASPCDPPGVRAAVGRSFAVDGREPGRLGVAVLAPADPPTLPSVPPIRTAGAVAAGYSPSRRALRVNSTVAWRK